MQGLKCARLALGLASVLGNLYPSSLPGQGGLQEFREVHLGLEVRVMIETDDRHPAARSARRAFDRIDALDLVMSDWRRDSELSLLSGRTVGVWWPISPELGAILALSLDIAEQTDGAFDPTIGPLTQLWRTQRTSGIEPTDSVWAEARSRVGWRRLTLDTLGPGIRFDRSGMRLDLGGVAKGWILEAAARELREDGVTRFLIEAGGDIVVGEPPGGRAGWQIRIARTNGDTTLVLANAALSTSGPSAQSLPMADGSSASHVVDMRSGRGSRSPLQVTVVGARAALTDALATALTVVPREQWASLLDRYQVALVATDP